MSTLTSNQYVYQMGLQCPQCLSPSILPSSRMESDAGIAWRVVKCSACAASWTETFSLVGYSGLLVLGSKAKVRSQI